MNMVRMVSAGCGAGKTFAICDHFKKNLFEQNQLYVAPTIKLIEQTATQLESIGIQAIKIHSESHPNPLAAIVDFLKNCESSGQVLLITWQAYCGIPYFHNRRDWSIFIDELPKIDAFSHYQVPFTSSFLTDYLDIGESNNGLTVKVVPKNRESLRSLVDKKVKKDEILNRFLPLFRDVLSDDKDVFVDLKSWTAICEQNKVGATDAENRVYFLSMLKPKLFAGATLLAANIESSMFYLWMTNYHGVQFEDHNEVISQLRGYSPDGERLRVNYFFEGRGWSKNLRDKNHEGQAVSDVMERILKDELGESEFLFIANNDYESSFDKLPNCKRISVDSKGMNQYQDFTKIVHLAALNLEPKHSSMLADLGIDAETVRNSISRECLYQNLMRTALRNPDSKEVVDVYVASEFDADYLISIFGSGYKKRISDIEFQKYVPLTATQRNRNSKARNIFSKKGDLPIFGDQLSIIKNKCNQISANDDNASPRMDYSLTICTSKYATAEDQFSIFTFSNITELVKTFRIQSKAILKTKDDAGWMFIPTIFEADDEGGYRKQKNFFYSSMMVLDFDDGKLSPEQFIKIFWDDAGRGQKRSFILMNTFSRSAEKPNRFRVLLPYKRPALGYDAHLAVYNSIVRVLAVNGFDQEASGLDHSCANGTQPFFPPCTNRDHPTWRLFETRGVEKRDIDRYAIDPDACLRTKLDSVPPVRLIQADILVSQRFSAQEVEAKLFEIRQDVLKLASSRRQPFFSAGLKMLNIGLDLSRIEGELSMLARQIGKEHENWVSETMKSLRLRVCQAA